MTLYGWRFSIVALLALVCARPALAAAAELKPAALFSDHAVLQRDVPVPVWGRATPGAKVIVTFAGQTREATADATGRWMARLDPMPASDSPREMRIESSDGGSIAIRDLLVGEVWVCSGQSNMTFALNRAKDADREISSAHHPHVRLFDVPRVPRDTPGDDVGATWSTCTPETATTFSAVAYFFGRDLQRALGVPVGLIHSSWGGTVAQNWSPRDTLEDPRFRAALERDRQRAATQPAGARAHKGGPGHLYNGMIHPLQPYAVRGVLWYQGETNRMNPNHYRELLPEMIAGWRRHWGQPALPFVIVQIANYLPPPTDPNIRSPWAEVREVQRMTANALPESALVVTIDVGDEKDLHPKNKQEVGRRTALAARRMVYGHDLVASGPAMKSVRFENGAAIIVFDHIGAGLVARDGGLRGFILAGADRKFVNAEAKILGDTVVVTSERVTTPAAVRYGWADNPPASLFNREGLPAGPFRSDDWPWEGPLVKR